MVIREGYRTNIGYPFDSSKGEALMVIREGYRTSIAPPLTPSWEGLMVIRRGYRTNINIWDKPRAPRGCILIEGLHLIQTYI